MAKEKIIKVVKIIVLIMVVILAIILIKKVMNKEEIPFITNTNAYIVLSGSMEPEIGVGDIVITTSVKQEDIKVGDIISFTKGTTMVTHRVTEINEENEVVTYKTKGDNNNTEDLGVITYDNVVGKYKSKIPKVGHIILFIQKYLIVVIAIFIFFTVFMLTKPQEKVQTKENETKENDDNKKKE